MFLKMEQKAKLVYMYVKRTKAKEIHGDNTEIIS